TIADFASDDAVQIQQLKQKIPADEWKRAYAMGLQYAQALPGTWRDGRPFFAAMPLAGAKEYGDRLQAAHGVRMMLAGGGVAGVVRLMLGCGVGFRAAGALKRPFPRVARIQPPAMPPARPVVPPRPPNRPPPGFVSGKMVPVTPPGMPPVMPP